MTIDATTFDRLRNVYRTWMKSGGSCIDPWLAMISDDSRRIEPGHQAIGVATLDRIEAYFVSIWKLDRQELTILAQLKCGLECLFVGSDRGKLRHGNLLLVIAVKPIEGA